MIPRGCCVLSLECLGKLKLTLESRTHLVSGWHIKYEHLHVHPSPARNVLGAQGVSTFPDWWAPSRGHPDLSTGLK